jgi:hypothetical protein
MIRTLCLAALFSLIAVGVLALAGCGKDEPKVSTNINDQFKVAHELVAGLRTALAGKDSRRFGMAIGNTATFINSLTNWVQADGKGNVEERKKALAAAVTMLQEDVMALANADPVDMAKVNAKLDEVDKLISQAE